MKILVIGSAGQIGKYLVSHLRSCDHQVFEFDLVNDSKQDLRIKNNPVLKKLISDSDFIFFLAFDVGGSRYLSKYQHTYEFMSNNMKIMDNTFDALMETGKPFIFTSSQMSNMSYSPYGVAKAVGENYTKALGGINVKFWNVYGAEYDHEKSHVITDFILKAKGTGKIDMLTDGKEEREFLYAEDCCEALVAIMNKYHEIPRDEELCITSFRSTKILEIAEIIAKHYGATVQPAAAIDQVQMDKRNVASIDILKYWQPKTSIEDGIRKVIEEIG